MIIRHRFKPINDIPREEMLKRNSFPLVNENRFLNTWLKERSKK
ncbi:6.6 kDa protein in eae-abc2 intergenic region [Salmonella enterica subsp. enterica serovar Newport str. USMARC-S3124.1]|nr:6.6 kDa protein in eae-abc2 intergenic region [Salmonella enterica subsp. enterica serovar Newport str. USMARC-S3124.1]